MRFAFAASVMIAGAFATPAVSQNPAGGGWVFHQFENVSRHTVDDTVHEIRADNEKIAAAFRCQDGALKAYISLNGEDISDSLARNGHARDVQTNFQFGDNSGREDWGYLARTNIVFPLRESTARKMYNAALRGDPIVIDARRFGRIELDLPPVDASLAAQFKDECGFGQEN